MTKTTTNITNAASGHAYAADIVSGRYHAENKVGFGDESEFVYASQSTPLPVDDPDLLYARGTPTGVVAVHKFGLNPDIDTGSAPEDLWTPGGLWSDTSPTVAQTYDIASSDAADAAAGTGMRTVHIAGLDSNWDLAEEEVTLNGTSSVSTVGTYWRIFRMYGKTWGTGRVNAGTITATGATDANVMAEIATSNSPNQTEMACYTVPAGYTAYVEDYYAYVRRNSPSGANATVALVTRDAEADLTLSGWRVRHEITASIEGNAPPFNFRRPLAVGEKMDISLRCLSISDNNTALLGGFDLLLVPNP